jgi:uncharacterized damage-inducible protein DinB
MKSLFSMLAGYNEWANRRLYDAVAKIPDADYRAHRGAFFSSLHGTLNHLVVADRIWMRRFTGTGPQQTRLDEIVYAHFEELRTARISEDARIITYIGELGDADLAGMLSYRTIAQPQEISQPLAPALTHFFNHQTHHRGQAHALLSGIGGRDAAPSLDLILFQRETGIGMA